MNTRERERGCTLAYKHEVTNDCQQNKHIIAVVNNDAI